MTPEQLSEYVAKQYTKGPLEAGMGMSPLGTGSVGSKVKLSTKIGRGLKRYGPETIAWLLLERYLSGRHKSKLQDIQMEAARNQVGEVSPDDLYYQAALPQAKAEEDMARNALLTQLTGGVIGPTLAKGERFIGG